MREHVVPLITQLMAGLSDQSPTLRKVYADAIGYLCKVNPHATACFNFD